MWLLSFLIGGASCKQFYKEIELSDLWNFTLAIENCWTNIERTRFKSFHREKKIGLPELFICEAVNDAVDTGIHVCK